MRQLKYNQAINEALELSLSTDERVYVMGLGVPDPKGVFGTTKNLQEKFGAQRVMDMPCAENGMTGIAIGSALTGMRPVMVHQRLDFALLALEQIVNQAANWNYMYGGKGCDSGVPLVIRLIVGRGWGQGPQHSQSLHSWFAHIPGLKVVMPATAYDAKGLLISSIEDNNPVIFIEHRWLHETTAIVPEEKYTVPIGEARVAREGEDITIVALSYMVLEALKAAELLQDSGISAEVIDLRSLRPLDETTIFKSIKKTGRLLLADNSWSSCSISSEIIARVCESCFSDLKSSPKRLCLPDCPSPSSPALSQYYYKRHTDIFDLVLKIIGSESNNKERTQTNAFALDVPNPAFTGPF